MGYSDTIKNVMGNISFQENMYIEVTNTARIHVYKERLDKVWYIVVCETLQDGAYTEESKTSACCMEDLKKIVGLSWVHCNML